MAPTSFVTVEELPDEFQHLPFEPAPSSDQVEHSCNFGEVGEEPQKSRQPDAERPPQNIRVCQFRERLIKGMHRQLRQLRPSDKPPPDFGKRIGERTPTTTVVHPRTIENNVVCESDFASTGSIGVVDLGASQTVIGSDQVSELLSKLPKHVRQQVKRTNCNLVFRFGNHQTLPSHHALLLPLNGSWFQIAVVKGNTPFLLSSNFLRTTIQAVIDTEQGTLWSKVLKKELTVEITPKNLFLLDINQLWEDHEQSANMTISLSSAQSDHVGLGATDTVRNAQEKQISSCRQLNCGKNHEKTEHEMNKIQQGELGDSANPGQEKCIPRDLGPNPVVNLSNRASSFQTHDGHSCTANEGTSTNTGSNRESRCRENDTRRVGQGDGLLWHQDDRQGLRNRLSRSGLGTVVCESLRDVSKADSSQVHPVRRTEAGPGGEECTTQAREVSLSLSIDWPNQEAGVGEIVDKCASGRGIGRRDAHDATDGTSGGGSGVHASGESSARTTSGQHGGGDGRDHRPPQEPSGEDRALMEANTEKIDAVLFAHNHILDPDPSIDTSYDFFTEHEAQSYTTQVNALGGRAKRFGLGEGDLSTSTGRRKLFQVLVRERPKDLWYSPVCAPWCKWSQFNALKSLALCEKVLNDGITCGNSAWR